MLQAEEDRDQVRRHWADQAREKELLGRNTPVYNSDRCVASLQDGCITRDWCADCALQICPSDLYIHGEHDLEIESGCTYEGGKSQVAGRGVDLLKTILRNERIIHIINCGLEDGSIIGMENLLH